MIKSWEGYNVCYKIKSHISGSETNTNFVVALNHLCMSEEDVIKSFLKK